MSQAKHWGIVGVALLSLLITAGCSQQAKQSNATAPAKSAKVKSSSQKSAKAKSGSKTSGKAKASKQSSSASSKASASSSQPATPWDGTKDAALASFIAFWEKTMGQSYTKFDGVHPLQTSVGIAYPTAFSEELVNGTPNQLAWRPDGTGDSSYNVVAIYNYDGTEPPMPNRITYFFAFHNGQPVVLVDQSRDGAPSAGETQNTALRTNFQRIATGQSAQ